jgi:DNA repair photolyase
MPQLYDSTFSITSQFAFCGLPLRLDTYRGCGFRCSYCFARNRGGNTPDDSIRAANPAQVERILHRAIDHGAPGVIADFLRRRTPVHFGGMSDPFQPAEAHHQATLGALKALARYEYPTVLSTRGTLIAKRPYLEFVRDLKNVVVQFSFSTVRDSVAQQVEPHATRPSELLRVMEMLSRHGIYVTCRWQPFIPGLSESPLEFIPKIANTGCRHVALEHLKLPVEREKPLWRDFALETERDFFEEYKAAGAYRDGREMLLPPLKKLATILRTKSEVNRHGMTFGAADNEFQYLSDTPCCCSGVDQFPGFENWFRHQIGFAVRQGRGEILRYESIAKEWCPTGSIDRYLNSKSRIGGAEKNRGSIRDHVRLRWNREMSPGSPTTFFGVIPLRTKRLSKSRQIEYSWDDAALRLLLDRQSEVKP